MKKVPSYPKITAKTNITVTQTQNININSPKIAANQKMFKNNPKKIKNNPQLIKNQSSKTMPLNQNHKTVEPIKRSHNKLSNKQVKPLQKQKPLKSTKSQRQLEILSEKLKKLQIKIKNLKQQQKQKRGGLAATSNRSFSKNRQSRDHSGYVKRDHHDLSNKHRKDYSKPLIRNNSTKILKKSYSDKAGLKLIKKQGIKRKNKQLQMVSKTKKLTQNEVNQSKLSQKEEHDAQVIHKFVTQVPNSHQYPPNLKQSIKESLKKNTYQMSLEASQHSFSTQKLLKDQYYVSKLRQSELKPSLIQFRQHLMQSLQTLHFLQKTRRPTPKQIDRHSIQLNKNKHKFTIVLDLDETLIHCNQTLHDPFDVKLNIRFPTGQRIDAGVNIRPFAKQFIESLSEICEVIVFTASHECYANVVLDYLDPQKKIVSYRLFRDHCWQTQEGIYIKDLRVLKNRNLQNILLVDNAAYSYYYQLQNGIPIIPYYDDKTDKQLPCLLNYIKSLIEKSMTSQLHTPKALNNSYFNLKQYIHFDEIDQLINHLYNKGQNDGALDSICTEHKI